MYLGKWHMILPLTFNTGDGSDSLERKRLHTLLLLDKALQSFEVGEVEGTVCFYSFIQSKNIEHT